MIHYAFSASSRVPRHRHCNLMPIMDVERIDSERARADVTHGNALLVCAYDTQEKFLKNHLGGALSLEDLAAMEDELPRDREIIFYCA
jgi:hypothetical protein